MGEAHGSYMDAIADDVTLINQMQNGLEEIFYPKGIQTDLEVNPFEQVKIRPI